MKLESKDTKSGFNKLEFLAKLMDAQFRLPGTQVRFGLDAIIGLIPGVGDLATFGISGYMVLIMARNGAGTIVLSRMVGNILLDAIFGSIPILGDIFDVAFKANLRNLQLMQKYYKPGRQRKNALAVFIPILIVLLLVIIGLIWGVYELLSWLFQIIFN